MLSIIFCHFLQYYGNSLAFNFNIGVQIFLIISGFLYGRQFQNYAVVTALKNCAKILIDYVIFCFFAIILNLTFNPESIALSTVVNLLSMSSFLPGLEHLWFAPLILFCYLLSPFVSIFCKFISNKSALIKSALIGLFLLVFSYFINSLFAGFNFVWVLCYTLSFILASLNLRKKANVILCCVLLILSALNHFLYNFQYDLLQQILILPVGNISDIFRLITSFAIFYALLILFNLIKFKSKHKFLDFTDTISYDVYLSHQIFILGPLTLLKATNLAYVNITICLVAIAALTTLVYFRKYFSLKLINRIKPKI